MAGAPRSASALSRRLEIKDPVSTIMGRDLPLSMAFTVITEESDRRVASRVPISLSGPHSSAAMAGAEQDAIRNASDPKLF